MTTTGNPPDSVLDDEQQARVCDCLREAAVDLAPGSRPDFKADDTQQARINDCLREAAVDPTPRSPLGFELNDEQQARTRDCLRKAEVGLTPESWATFCLDIEASIGSFLAVRSGPDATARHMHNEIRGIWIHSHEEDPPVGQLRVRVFGLSASSLNYLAKRAQIVLPKLFGGATPDHGFLEWVKNAAPEDLVQGLAAISGEGGRLVSRGRGEGKRSAPTLEPRILGYVRGAGDGPKGGRPEHAAPLYLIRLLATDWIIATGEPPKRGRSDHLGFGDLVHCVFQWIEEPAADQALRRYWDEVEEGKNRLAELDARPAAEVESGFRQQD